MQLQGEARFELSDRLRRERRQLEEEEGDDGGDLAGGASRGLTETHPINPERSEFTEQVAYYEALGTHLSFSTAYHPQTGGQTERVNQIPITGQAPKKKCRERLLLKEAYWKIKRPK